MATDIEIPAPPGKRAAVTPYSRTSVVHKGEPRLVRDGLQLHSGSLAREIEAPISLFTFSKADCGEIR
ncbi:unnamed protein product [Gadus morhua 'NCC']